MRRLAIVGAAAASLLLGIMPLTACAPDPVPQHTQARTASPSTTTAEPTPTVQPVALPTDCRAMLSPDVLLQLADVPLNDPAFGSGVGVQPDGSLTCVWADPRSDTTSLWTQVVRTDATAAQTILDGLRTNGYGCYASQDGTRCERTWQNKTYPVTDGRTWFWRDDIIIDTHYSNLAPDGYTASIVTHLFG
ncbi:hypothetical protein [Microbacterium terrisoli]|uniref:hypothetical protein n=1 Tax=Microbacterium terrisoli TaxID=3242192 RepID=UPI002803EF50|nr:hypothetical protein [Microbacterium protaetiae]